MRSSIERSTISYCPLQRASWFEKTLDSGSIATNRPLSMISASGLTLRGAAASESNTIPAALRTRIMPLGVVEHRDHGTWSIAVRKSHTRAGAQARLRERKGVGCRLVGGSDG